MANNDVYIYYSGATDKTGKALCEALDIDGGAVAPKTNKKVVIGWGTKTTKEVNMGNSITINHPNSIRANRDKYSALTKLKERNVNVANFMTAEEANNMLKSKKNMSMPIIGRTKYHQGGKGFWTCLDEGMVQEAIHEGAYYFQERIPIKDEYRLHIFDGNLIYAQKKVKRDDMEKAFIDHQMGKIENAADRGGKKLDKDTINFILERQAKEQAEHADMLIRSNERGWKFISIKTSSIKEELLQQAVKAVSAVGLDFGAVDCCTDLNGKSWIIEINSGPGLDGKSFKAYVETLDQAIRNRCYPSKTKTNEKTTSESSTSTTSAKPESNKSILKQKLSLLQEMIDVADTDELVALNKVAAKMFGG